jgi:hypothetical protein
MEGPLEGAPARRRAPRRRPSCYPQPFSPQPPVPQEPLPQEPLPHEPLPQDPVPQEPLPQELFPQAPVPQLPPPQLEVPHLCWVAAAPLPLLPDFFRLLQPWVARVSPPRVSAIASPAMLTVFFSSFMDSFHPPAPYSDTGLSANVHR